MAVWAKEACRITNKGKNLLARLQAGEQLEIVRVVCGSNTVENSVLDQQTEILDIKKELEFRKIIDVADNKATFFCSLNNVGVTEAFVLNQIGIYARDPGDDTNEILYIIMQVTQDADIIPTETSMPNFQETYTLNTLFENTAGFTVAVSPLDLVTEEEFQHLQRDFINLYNRLLEIQNKVSDVGCFFGDDGTKYRWGKDDIGVYYEEADEGGGEDVDETTMMLALNDDADTGYFVEYGGITKPIENVMDSEEDLTEGTYNFEIIWEDERL